MVSSIDMTLADAHPHDRGDSIGRNTSGLRDLANIRWWLSGPSK
jgi:hypothetical protein